MSGYATISPRRKLTTCCWLVSTLVISGLVGARLMRRFDNRLVLATGFAIVAVAALLKGEGNQCVGGREFLCFSNGAWVWTWHGIHCPCRIDHPKLVCDE